MSSPEEIESPNLKKDLKYKMIFKKHQKCAAPKRHFTLMRTTSLTAVASNESRIRVTNTNFRKPKRENGKREVRFNPQDDQSCYMKMSKCHQKGRIYKRKNIWTNAGHGDCGCIYSQELNQIGLDCVDFRLSQTRDSKRRFYKSPSGSGYNHYEKLTHLQCSKHSIDFVYDAAEKVSDAERLLSSGDHSCSSLTKIFDDYLEAVHLNRKTPSSKSSREINLKSCRSMPNFCSSVSEELFYSSKKVTVFVRKTRSLEIVESKMHMFEITHFEEEQWRFISSRICKKQSLLHSHKNLEYYVDLVNGDLVWSNTLPLEPQNYNTYYNFSNHSLAKKKQSKDSAETRVEASVEEPMNSIRLTPEEASYMRSLSVMRHETPSHDPSRRNAISDSSQHRVEYIEKLQFPKKSGRVSKLPPEFASYSMEPESTNRPWAPFVVSETSLPTIKEKVARVQTAPTTSQSAEKKAKKAKSKCSSKPVCVRNECVNCASKHCKKNRPGDIRIAIKKVKGGKCMEAETTISKPCNKEICEIYKNKNLIPDKSTVQDRDGHFTITAKDNIKIYISNKKCKVDCKDKKSTEHKPSDHSKKDDTKK